MSKQMKNESGLITVLRLFFKFLCESFKKNNDNATVAERFWDMVSMDYEKPSNPKQIELREKTIELISTYLKKSDMVMDYGCDSGKITFTLADKVKHIDGLDISDKMIAIAVSKVKEQGINNVLFKKTHLFDEKFKFKTYDVILALNVLLFIEDSHENMNRLNNLLKPGGILIAATTCMGEKKTVAGHLITFIIGFISKIGIFPFVHFYKENEFKETIKKGKYGRIK